MLHVPTMLKLDRSVFEKMLPVKKMVPMAAIEPYLGKSQQPLQETTTRHELEGFTPGRLHAWSLWVLLYRIYSLLEE